MSRIHRAADPSLQHPSGVGGLATGALAVCRSKSLTAMPGYEWLIDCKRCLAARPVPNPKGDVVHDKRMYRLTACPPARSPHFHGDVIHLGRPCINIDCDLDTAVYVVSHEHAVRAGLVTSEGEQVTVAVPSDSSDKAVADRARNFKGDLFTEEAVRLFAFIIGKPAVCPECGGTGVDPHAQPPIALGDGRRMFMPCPVCVEVSPTPPEPEGER